MITKESYVIGKSESVFPKEINLDKLKRRKSYISTRGKEILASKKVVKHHSKMNEKGQKTIERDAWYVGDVPSDHPLTMYSGYSSPLNHALVKSHKNMTPVPKKHIKFMSELDKHLTDPENGLKDKVVTYSGISKEFARQLSEAKPGRTIHLPAYTSTSIDRDQAVAFSKNNHILVFHLPKGYSKGRYIENLSKFPDEKEMTLARNQKFRYLDRRVHHIVRQWDADKFVYHHLEPI